jgi:hypothetical protein
LRPFQKGQSGNPAGRSGPYLETQRLARDAAPDVTRRLIEIALTDPDTRVAVVAGNSVLDRAFGKPRDYDPKEDKPPSMVDVSVLSVSEQRMMLDFLRRVLVMELAPEPLPEFDGAADK